MTTKYHDIIDRIEKINPIRYAKDRNYIDGSVSRLSPYISRGVISTKFVYEYLTKKGYTLKNMQKFVQELVWREFWQITWINNNINKDLRQKQKNTFRTGIPLNIYNCNTGINIIDSSIKELYKNGYMHNHLRMYVASLITNIAKYHWKIPARWMYYYLLDADWGSNALSWQWVAGTNSNNKYLANQQNINRFTKTFQKNTILDKAYNLLENEKNLKEYSQIYNLNLKVHFPKSDDFTNIPEKPICIYNFYNLDIKWRKDLDAHRILLIEPSIFNNYPISKKSMKFMINLSKNIKNIKIVVKEFKDLPVKNSKIYFKEHPLNHNYFGIKDEREWLCKPSKKINTFYKHWSYVINRLIK